MITKYVRLRNVDSVLECFDDIIINAKEEMGSNRNATIGNIVDFVTTNGKRNCPHGCKVTFLPEDETVNYDITVITRHDNEGSSSDIERLGTVTWTDRKVVGSELTE